MSAGLKDNSFPGAKRHLREVRRLMYMGEKEVPPCSEESQNREGDVKGSAALWRERAGLMKEKLSK